VRKIDLLKLIVDTKKKVHELNLKLRQEDDDEVFKKVEFLTNEEEISNKYNLDDNDALF